MPSRGMSFTVCITPLLLSVDLKIAFWFFNDRKHREDHFGISVIFFIYFFTKVCFSFAFFVKTINSNINIQLNLKEEKKTPFVC